MRIKRRTRSHLDVDVSSFADIAFLLIIFFILTTTFVKPAGGTIELPSGSADPQKAKRKYLTISLVGDTIRYGPQGAAMTPDEVRAALLLEAFAARAPDDRIVVVQSAPDVPYGLYYKVVMAIDAADGVLALLEDEEGTAR